MNYIEALAALKADKGKKFIAWDERHQCYWRVSHDDGFVSLELGKRVVDYLSFRMIDLEWKEVKTDDEKNSTNA